MLRHRIAWPIVVSFLCCACERNPQSGVFEEGRLYLWLDLRSNHVSWSYLEIRVEAEGYEPITKKIFDFNLYEGRSDIIPDVSDAIAWYEATDPQRPLLLLEDILEGGSEIYVRVAAYQSFDFTDISFKLDGNTSLRVYVENPDKPGGHHLWIDRSSQGSAF